MSRFLTPLISRDIDTKYSEIYEPLIYESDVLKENGYPNIIEVHPGFICDFESVPRYLKTKYGFLNWILNVLLSPFLAIIYWLLSNTSRRGGAIHDKLYRKGVLPDVPKLIKDLVYLEVMELVGNKKWKRAAKHKAVEWFGDGSYQVFDEMATYKDITGKDEPALPSN